MGGRQRTSSKVSSASAIAIASRPPGASTVARAAQERGPALGPAEQLDGLHRHEDQPEAPPRRGRSRARRRRPSRPAARPRARAARRAASAERSSATTSWPRAGEMQRHAAGAGADVEHRAAVDGREVAPQRQVLGVGAALDVVPDDLGHVRGPGGAHAKLLPAAPRATSRSRSASIAVYVGQREQAPVAVGERPVERRRRGRRRPRSAPARRPRTSAAAPSRPRACRCTSRGARGRRAARSRRPRPSSRRGRRRCCR